MKKRSGESTADRAAVSASQNARKTHGLAGVDAVPLPPKPRGRPSAQLRDEWLDVVEELMVRGVRSPTSMARRTGLTFHTAKRWMNEIENRWRMSVGPDEIRLRFFRLCAEIQEVSRTAWGKALSAKNPHVAAGYLQIILNANARFSSLWGLE